MAYRTILLKGDPVIEERAAGGTIAPGSLVEINSANAVVVHPTSGGNAIPMFALEDENQGKGVTTNYSSSNQVRFGIFRPGDRVAALLYTGQTVVVGTKLESHGDGTLWPIQTDAPSATTSEAFIAIAMEAKTASGNELIDVMIA
jgi:hypothetical protein